MRRGSLLLGLGAVWAFRLLPELCCRHAFAWPWTSPILTCWLDFPAWFWTCFVIIDLPDNHWTVSWIWLLSPALILILTWLQITSCHFGLVLWSGLLDDPNYHNQTNSACLAIICCGITPLSVKILPPTVLLS